MGALAQALPCPVQPASALGWNGDAIEAQAFAYLAVRALEGLPLTFPTTTGRACAAHRRDRVAPLTAAATHLSPPRQAP